jgi:hypothetical protein
MVATSMNCLGHRGMFFLAAAVSDFYVPWESMVGSIFNVFMGLSYLSEPMNCLHLEHNRVHLKQLVHVR